MKQFQLNTLCLALLTLMACGGGSSGPETSTPTPTPPPAPTPTPPPAPAEPAFNVDVTFQAPQISGLQACDSDGQNSLFVEVTQSAGITYQHLSDDDGIMGMSGGVAAGDINGDGFIDLYAVGGEGQPNVFLLNQRDGSFSQSTDIGGFSIQNRGSGPSFGDFNGDGALDLFIGSVGGAAPYLLLNDGNGNFSDITESSQLDLPGNNFSATWGDYDKDGDLDLAVTHWTTEQNDHYAYLWRNNGDMTFTDVSLDAGIPPGSTRDKTFTPTFVDINNNGWLDLLMIIDNGNTRVYFNNQDGTFNDVTDFDVITDRAGMGSAVGDYDNDGDLDWFVSSISFEDGVTNFGSLTPGNRFYENQGDGTFVDVTDETGVRHGFWGWGACFADFNNDSHLDIFHVNGMLDNGQKGVEEIFETDPSRLFMSNGDKTFTEQAVAMGIADNGMGRGVSCFDYDRDGDLDLFVANYNQAPKLYCNTLNDNNFINIKLRQDTANTEALGARVYIEANGVSQFQEIKNGNNFVSQNPAEAHFGLSNASTIDTIRIVWPDGEETEIEAIDANQFMTVTRTTND